MIVWDATDFKKIDEFSGMAAFWSPDGTRLAVADEYRIKIRDAATNLELASWHHPSASHRALCWSPDSRFVAGSHGHEGYLWDATTGRPVATLEGHTDVMPLVWSPDGQRLATAADDATVRLWDTTSGTQVFTLRGLRGSVLSVGWSADGLMLAAGANDGTIRLWDATSGSAIDHSPSRLHVLDARLTADPSDVAALRSRADLHARLEQWDEAAADYDRVANSCRRTSPHGFNLAGGVWESWTCSLSPLPLR